MNDAVQEWYAASRKLADANETFLFLVTKSEDNPDPMTKEELERLIERRPALWGRYANWLDKLPSSGK